MSAVLGPAPASDARIADPVLALAEASARVSLVRTPRAPHLRSRLDDRRVMGAFALALAPTFLWALHHVGASLVLPLLATAVAVAAFWERLFAALRGREPDHRALVVVALLFTLGLPAALPLWQAAVGISFGVVVGKEIFGGFGRNVAHPAVVGLVFLHLAWPEAISGRVALGHGSLAACALGAALLVATGAGSWRVVLGGIAGLAAAAIAQPASGSAIAALAAQATGAVTFALVFLATDPVTAPLTNPARWLYGAAIGALFVVIRVANPAQREVVVLAVLMGNLLAPLLDEAVLRLHAARRARRRG